MSGVLEERSATAVHATLTALVRTNAAASPAWADYEALLLDPATASFFESRLPDTKALVGRDFSIDHILPPDCGVPTARF